MSLNEGISRGLEIEWNIARGAVLAEPSEGAWGEGSERDCLVKGSDKD